MPVIKITTLDTPELSCYATLTEAQLRNRLEPEKGIFIAESPKVIRTAIAAGYEPLSLLCEERHIKGDAADIIASRPELTIYTASRPLLAQLTGYTLTRGVLAAMRRKPFKPLAELLTDAHRIVIIDSVVDTTNIGAIFRSATALGIDAILLTPTSCDPLNRRAVRVSMGTVFQIPWTWLDTPVDTLKTYGFKTVAMALTDKSVPLDHPQLKTEPKLALIMGTEGDGLAIDTINNADYTVRIPMHHGVDSLNVAAATAVACWELRYQKQQLQS